MAKKNSQKKSQNLLQNIPTEATDYAKSALRSARQISKPTLFWGLGAVAIGAAAYGVYKYRSQLMDMYDSAMGMMKQDSSDALDSEMTERTSSLPSNARTNSEMEINSARAATGRSSLNGNGSGVAQSDM